VSSKNEQDDEEQDDDDSVNDNKMMPRKAATCSSSGSSLSSNASSNRTILGMQLNGKPRPNSSAVSDEVSDDDDIDPKTLKLPAAYDANVGAAAALIWKKTKFCDLQDLESGPLYDIVLNQVRIIKTEFWEKYSTAVLERVRKTIVKRRADNTARFANWAESKLP
jgi:hypothetical protein